MAKPTPAEKVATVATPPTKPNNGAGVVSELHKKEAVVLPSRPGRHGLTKRGQRRVNLKNKILSKTKAGGAVDNRAVGADPEYLRIVEIMKSDAYNNPRNPSHGSISAKHPPGLFGSPRAPALPGRTPKP